MRAVIRSYLLITALGMLAFASKAYAEQPAHGTQGRNFRKIEKLPPITITDEQGQFIQAENDRRWKLICGSNTANLDQAGFDDIVEKSKESLQGPFAVVGGNALRGGAFNVVFNVSGAPPAGATAALDAIAAYYESQFSDPITVTFSVSFAPLGPGILGSTSSDYVNNISYNNIRTNLLNHLDFDDQIQNFLPTGSSCPVRYDSNSATVTNQTTMDITEANWAAMTNTDVVGTNASITISTNFTFDYDPSNGVSGTCFRSVMIHEVGHALGFTSSVDFGPGDMEGLDLFRFQTTDGAGDYNPDDSAEFQARPRLVHNNSPDDSHHTETMAANGTLVEYRMSDGNPDQASHWRNQGNPGIGIMNPSIGGGFTYSPNYLRTADLAALDEIGWDYPAVDPGDVVPPTPDPMSFTVLPFGSSATTVTMQATLATDAATPPVQYQFDFTAGSSTGHDSAFQASRDYVDTVAPNNFYSYRVRARDSKSPTPNVTGYSASSNGATAIETPLSVSFGTTDDTSIVANADGTFTNLTFGTTGFYFDMSPAVGSGANVWVQNATTTITGLTPCTQYTIRVKARNFQSDETPFTTAAVQLTTGCTGCMMEGDMNNDSVVDGDDIAGFVRTKLGTPAGGDFAACADMGNNDLDLDIAEFAGVLVGP